MKNMLLSFVSLLALLSISLSHLNAQTIPGGGGVPKQCCNTSVQWIGLQPVGSSLNLGVSISLAVGFQNCAVERYIITVTPDNGFTINNASFLPVIYLNPAGYMTGDRIRVCVSVQMVGCPLPSAPYCIDYVI
jgi:hypothetical protein